MAVFSIKDMLAVLRPQSRTHGFRAHLCHDSFYINIVNIQITNLVVERKMVAEQKQGRLAELGIKFSRLNNLPPYLPCFFVLILFYVSREFFHDVFFFTWLLAHHSQKEDQLSVLWSCSLLWNQKRTMLFKISWATESKRGYILNTWAKTKE